MKKIIFVASSGGHFSELMKLEDTMQEYKSIIVAEKAFNTNNADVDYYLKYGVRTKLFKYFFVFMFNFFKTIYILIKERPNAIVSTGSHCCVVFIIIGRIFKIKTVYIESYAKVSGKSLTYRLIKKYTDVVIVQHKEMLDIYEDSIYLGGIY